MKTLGLLSSLLCFCCVALIANPYAIIEDKRTHLFLPHRNNLTIREFVRIQVLDEKGYKHVVFQDYYNAFKKIKTLHYTVFDSNNKKVKRFSKADARDILVNSAYEIDDARLLILDPQYRSFPFTVEIEVETTFNGFLGFPQWMPRYSHGIEIKNAEMTLECYKDFNFRSREFNGVEAPTVSASGELKKVRWSVKNLPAVERHISYKSFASDQAKVYLAPIQFSLENTEGEFSNWSKFGEWYRNLNQGRNAISATTKEFLNGLRKEHGDNTEAIARAVYKFMQGKTRYISIQLGIGGYQTIPADEVERTGYGDCKALTNYMSAMLGYLNIYSNSVLTNAGRDVPDILEDFPSNQFNHVFLAVPLKRDTLWFECTSQTAPSAYIGTFTDDRYALWIDKNESTLIRTPSFKAHESIITNHGIVNIESQGDALIELKVTQRGMFYDEAMYYESLPADKIEKFNYAKFGYPDFSLQSFTYAFPEKDVAVIGLFYKLKVNGLGKQLGTKILIPSNVLSPIESFFDVDLMNKKIEIRRSFTIEDSVQIVLPKNYRMGVIPEQVMAVSEFGTFEMNFKTAGENVLYIYRKAVIMKGKYENENFTRFYDVVKKIKGFEQKKILVQSKT